MLFHYDLGRWLLQRVLTGIMLEELLVVAGNVRLLDGVGGLCNSVPYQSGIGAFI